MKACHRLEHERYWFVILPYIFRVVEPETELQVKKGKEEIHENLYEKISL
jgi:hypothetical protein